MVAIPVFNGFLMMGYSTVFTMLPVFSLILDKDVELEQVLKFPPLYKSLQKGRSLNFKTFMIWVWISIYQGAVIMLFSIIFFNDSFVNIVSITFTSLIFIELLNILTQVHRLQPKIVFSILLTILIYLSSILFFRNYFDTSAINQQFLIKVLIITVICWLPIHLIKRIVERISPSEEAKVKVN
jgi:phospholipid-translocating ATPase